MKRMDNDVNGHVSNYSILSFKDRISVINYSEICIGMFPSF